MAIQPYSFLALGDSYTVGEGVPLFDSFPYQTVRGLRRKGRAFTAPEIVARTGWTTDELAMGLASSQFLPSYDFVSLAIGVNNQYRGRPAEEYAMQFDDLLREAIRLSAIGAGHVIVLSIPDWSLSPFAYTQLPDRLGRSRADVAREIDILNQIASAAARRYGVFFLDITELGRSVNPPDSPDPRQFTADGLHPSALQYSIWAEQIAAWIQQAQ